MIIEGIKEEMMYKIIKPLLGKKEAETRFVFQLVEPPDRIRYSAYVPVACKNTLVATDRTEFVECKRALGELLLKTGGLARVNLKGIESSLVINRGRKMLYFSYLQQLGYSFYESYCDILKKDAQYFIKEIALVLTEGILNAGTYGNGFTYYLGNKFDPATWKETYVDIKAAYGLSGVLYRISDEGRTSPEELKKAICIVTNPENNSKYPKGDFRYGRYTSSREMDEIKPGENFGGKGLYRLHHTDGVYAKYNIQEGKGTELILCHIFPEDREKVKEIVLKASR